MTAGDDAFTPPTFRHLHEVFQFLSLIYIALVTFAFSRTAMQRQFHLFVSLSLLAVPLLLLSSVCNCSSTDSTFDISAVVIENDISKPLKLTKKRARRQRHSSVFIVRGVLGETDADHVAQHLNPASLDWSKHPLLPSGIERRSWSSPQDSFVQDRGTLLLLKKVNDNIRRIAAYFSFVDADDPLEYVTLYARQCDGQSWEGWPTDLERSGAVTNHAVNEYARTVLGVHNTQRRSDLLSDIYAEGIVEVYLQLTDPKNLEGGQLVLSKKQSENEGAITHQVILNKGDALFIRNDKYTAAITPVTSGRTILIHSIYIRKSAYEKKVQGWKQESTRQAVSGTEEASANSTSDTFMHRPQEQEVVVEEEEGGEEFISMVSHGEMSVNFRAMDENSDGELSRQEFTNVVQQLQYGPVKQSNLDALFHALGRNLENKNHNSKDEIERRREGATAEAETPTARIYWDENRDRSFQPMVRYHSHILFYKAVHVCLELSNPWAWAWRDYPSIHPRAEQDAWGPKCSGTLARDSGDQCRDYHAACDASRCKHSVHALLECPRTCGTCQMECEEGDLDHLPLCGTHSLRAYQRDSFHDHYPDCLNKFGLCALYHPKTRCQRTRKQPLVAPPTHPRNSLAELFSRIASEHADTNLRIIASPGDGNSESAHIMILDDFLPRDIAQELRSERICTGVWSSSLTQRSMLQQQKDGEMGAQQDDDANVHAYRSSSTCFCRSSSYCIDHPAIRYLDERVSNVTGIPGVELYSRRQLLRYAEGGYYREHTDHLNLHDVGGERLLTFFIYLNDVEEGGETFFPSFGAKVEPRAGRAVVWNNVVDRSVDIEPQTRHAAMPVIRGEKYSINYWIWLYKSNDHHVAYCGREKSFPLL